MFSQTEHRCRHEWGRDGARRAAARGDILVVVDILSFSTTVVTAVEHGIHIYPCGHGEEEDRAAAPGAVRAVHRRDVPERGRFSLSPLSFLGAEPGTRVLLASPNGATCSRHAHDLPHLLVGALVNAAAVARRANSLLATTELGITVLSCGERWDEPGEDGALRFALGPAEAVVPVAGLPPLSMHLVLKMILNAHSTLVMGRLGRFDGNVIRQLYESSDYPLPRKAPAN